ncbi:MAG: hypothetical protein RL754_753 [Bacteroidota bacterium]|jgi:predicted esterase
MAVKWLPVVQEQRVDVLGELVPETKNVWIGLHGYGQLVQFFSRHFRDFVTEDRAFVFPQGPHKFYLNGVSGRVGASWMTKEDRLVDIDNQRVYLEQVRAWVAQQCPMAEIHVVAFSQGVATGMRWLGRNEGSLGAFLAWAGSWPPDLDEKSIAGLKSTRFQGWFGTEDEFIGLEKQEEILRHYREELELVLPYDRYEGGHRFDSAILGREIDRLEKQ